MATFSGEAEVKASSEAGNSSNPNETSGPDEVLQERANALKAKGNECFKEGSYETAIEFYSQAIDVCPNAILYANRSACYLKTESFGLGMSDAKESIKLDPRYVKGYYRLGSAHMLLGHYKDAQKVFKRVTILRPKDASARQKYKQCTAEVKRQAFEEAIKTEDAEPLCETIDLNGFHVPDNYAGPRLDDDGPITVKFCEELMQWMFEQQVLHKRYAALILKKLRTHLESLESLVEITIPEGNEISVCGDTHGQYYDLMNIFDINGNPSETNPYLFNGDFVDRGSWSVEVVLTLFAWKLALPNHMHLMRGNHETRNMNRIYGFDGEVKHKYDDMIMQMFTEVFRVLPLAATLNNKVIIMHGGLFQEDGVKISDIKKIQRNCEPPESGLMSDILWSDPQPFSGRGPSKRGVGQSFGPDITKAFLEDNGLELLVRSHEVKEEGYLVEHDEKLITVFSAPNYCDQMGNKGALIRFGADCKPEFKQFEAVSHPDIKPMAYASNMGLYGM
uniref:Serine/threonine-protein phosphatase n=1 Tax=Aplanochytrium stocchinoi TaxID=215587 RepID=A0A7S3PRS1_9STRA|mmetsp:Transcript_12740/g.15816  ORF Transcript_12740/g.15816 Transcript_12740/m.15816 type:complete len:505 (+) Transcript_12740:64-1578(+)